MAGGSLWVATIERNMDLLGFLCHFLPPFKPCLRPSLGGQFGTHLAPMLWNKCVCFAKRSILWKHAKTTLNVVNTTCSNHFGALLSSSSNSDWSSQSTSDDELKETWIFSKTAPLELHLNMRYGECTALWVGCWWLLPAAPTLTLGSSGRFHRIYVTKACRHGRRLPHFLRPNKALQ